MGTEVAFRYLYRIFLALVALSFQVGCSVSTSLLNLGSGASTETLTFDGTHLNLSGLSNKIYSTGTDSSGHFQLNLIMQEYIYENKLSFINLPSGAELTCIDVVGNLALKSIDLVAEKKIQFVTSFWMASTQSWIDDQVQDFSCYYEVNGQRSNSISFRVTLNESKTVAVSVPNYTGVETYGASYYGVISGDASVVAFVTDLDITVDDTNSSSDIYIRDLQTGDLTRVSIDSLGDEGNADSVLPVLSGDGRYVAFESWSSNLVAGDTNAKSDIFIHDRQTGSTTRVSVDSGGVQGNGYSSKPSISSDGRYVAFHSDSTNLVVGDTNSKIDVFVHDRQTGLTTRVSVSSAGVQGSQYSSGPSISGDGRYVTFASNSSNLVAGDTNLRDDIFVHDRQTGVTTRVSVDSAGVQGNDSSADSSISSDGRHVAFYSWSSNLVAGDTNSKRDVFVHDRQTGVTTRVSVDSAGLQGDDHVWNPSLSSDGRYVVFSGLSSNLVTGDTNGKYDIFVHDLQTGVTTRLSVDSGGVQGNGDSTYPFLSGDGRYIVYESSSSNLVTGDNNRDSDVFIHDRQTGENARVSAIKDGVSFGNYESYGASLSSDGRYTAFYSESTNLVANDLNWAYDIFVHDRQTGSTAMVSVDSMGIQGDDYSQNPSLSADGRYVAFESWSTNLVPGDTNGNNDIFVHDRQTGVTTRVSVDSAGVQANGNSYRPALSSDGRYVAFDSLGTNLVAGDTNAKRDIFVHDRQTGVTTRVSVDSVGIQGNGDSYAPSFSGDGRYVAFYSNASNLVGGDTNSNNDIFVHDLQAGVTTRVSVDSLGTQGNGGSYGASLSGDGRYVAFESSSSNLVAGDTNGVYDVFVHDRQTGVTERVSMDSVGTASNGASFLPSMSSDGRYVAFESVGSNLVTGDTNGAYDVFVHDRQTGLTKRVSVSSEGAEGGSGAYQVSLSGDGRYAAFESSGSSFVEGDTNNFGDIFVHSFYSQ